MILNELYKAYGVTVVSNWSCWGYVGLVVLILVGVWFLRCTKPGRALVDKSFDWVMKGR